MFEELNSQILSRQGSIDSLLTIENVRESDYSSGIVINFNALLINYENRYSNEILGSIHSHSNEILGSIHSHSNEILGSIHSHSNEILGSIYSDSNQILGSIYSQNSARSLSEAHSEIEEFNNPLSSIDGEIENESIKSWQTI
jgi:hypothetical protein